MKKLRYRITKLVAVFILVISFTVLSGWVLNIPLLINVFPGVAGMNFNTALCFILCGFSLFLLDDHVIASKRKRIAAVLSFLVLILTILTSIEYCTGFDLFISERFWKEQDTGWSGYVPRTISLSASTNFIISSLALIFLACHRYNRLVQIVILLAIPISVMIILRQVFGNSFLDGFTLLKHTALNTSVNFILLYIGMLNVRSIHELKFSFGAKMGVLPTLFVLGLVFFANRENSRRFIETANLVDRTEQVLLTKVSVTGFSTSYLSFFSD